MTGYFYTRIEIEDWRKGREMPLGRRISSSADNQKEPLVGASETQKDLNSLGKRIDTQENAGATLNVFREEEPQYSFNDIVLNKSTYDAIQDVLTLYERKEFLFDTWGLGESHKKQKQSGINLYGASGTGKSMAAHAIAKQLGRKILTVDYSQIESKYVGETSKNLVAMFDYARETESIIFFDEADALLSKRVTDMSSSTDVSVNQTRSVLLVLINEFDDLILFASNFITNYDPAFMRRILAHVKFDLPDESNRFKLWRMYIPRAMPTDANVELLAQKYDAISGADISNAVLNAALKAARLQSDSVKQSYFEEAIQTIIHSREENTGIGKCVSKRTVSEEYVKTQFEGRLPK